MSPRRSYSATTLLSVLQCYITVPSRTLSALVSTKVPYMGRVYTPVSLVLPGSFPEPPRPVHASASATQFNNRLHHAWQRRPPHCSSRGTQITPFLPTEPVYVVRYFGMRI